MGSELWLRMRREESEQFHSLVKMHLSFLLDLNTDDCDCSLVLGRAGGGAHGMQEATPRKKSGAVGLFTGTPKRFRRGLMDGLPLTMEGVCQIYQLILYLSSEERIVTEGIFRKHGSLKKAQSLRERLNKGLSIDLDDEEFSVHEVASVFKSFLADLPEPLLTDSYYGAHVQVTGLEDEDPKKIQCLQLLFLLIPEPHYRLLKDTLLFLHKVSRHQDRNKMSASNLGTVFSTHILCPRKISAEALKSNHVLLTKSVGFMIQRAPELFDVPDQLTTDIKLYWNQRKKNAGSLAVSEPSPPGSPVVNTVFTFVDRRTTKEVSKESSTDTALAALYAHVQALPESAQKKKLIQRLNDANGCGTPGRVTPSAVSSSKKGLRAGVVGGGGLKSLLTPKRASKEDSALLSSGRNGSYSFSTPFKSNPQLNSFKRQTSGVSPNQKLLSPQSSPAILVSPKSLEAAINSSTPQRVTSLLRDHKKTITTPNGLQGPSIDLHSPLRAQEGQEHSPITSVALKMPSEMQETLMTPRCRRPVMAMIVEPTESPCQPSKYNEDEPSPLFNDEEGEEEEGISSSSCDESDKYFESLEDDDDLDQSLLPEFKKYILEKVAGKKTEGISEEVNELLNGELALSESMRMVLDGVDPEPSVLEPVDVDEMPQDYEKGNDENHLSHGPRKRLSLTEKSSTNPLSLSNKSQSSCGASNPKSIYFETDL